MNPVAQAKPGAPIEPERPVEPIYSIAPVLPVNQKWPEGMLSNKIQIQLSINKIHFVYGSRPVSYTHLTLPTMIGV